MAITVEELKEMLIEERMMRIINSIPNGHCPNAYYCIDYVSGCVSEDLDDSCYECKKRFAKAMEKKIREEVEAL